MSNLALTHRGVYFLSNDIEQEIYVQLLDLKKMKTTDRTVCWLSDGLFKIKAFINESLKLNEKDNLAILKATSHAMLEQFGKPYAVFLYSCEIVDHYDQELGQPIDFFKSAPSDAEKARPENTPVIHAEHLRSYQKNKAPQPNKSHPEAIERTQIKPQSRFIEETSEVRIEDTEKISDLYADQSHWQIVVRLVKKNYKQFVSKNGRGKLTKVMNLDLMDSTGMMITGAMFGDTAIQFYQALKENEVYRVSKGQIREDQYNQNKGRNYSRHSLMFTKNSEFMLIPTLTGRILVPGFERKLENLQSIALNHKIGDEFDAAAILLNIEPVVEITKPERTLYKQALEICDPEHNVSMEAIIWNNKIDLDPSLLGKTIVLHGFRLNHFNEKLSLNSSFNSEIKLLVDHPYNQYEGNIVKGNMEMLSEKKQKKIEIQQPCKNLKELENELNYLDEFKDIRSTLNLIVNFISSKNWFYQSCPHCRKSAEAMTKCNFCEKYIEETIPRYKLNLELSDSCGAIWATGFEEMGHKLFEDFPGGINSIKKLNDEERQALFEKRQFQELTVKITSKMSKDNSAVKHTVNRVADLNVLATLDESIMRIKKHIL